MFINLNIDEIVEKSNRCTQATLMTFGINGCPYHRSGVLEYLKVYGFTTVERKEFRGKKLIDLKYLKGNFTVHTKNHAMALVNGYLVDTQKQGFDNRTVENVWEVFKNYEEIN
jgi:hypothetical protein